MAEAVGARTGVPAPRVSETTGDCSEVAKAAKRIGWLKVIVASGIALLAAGAGAALYASQFATHDEVKESVGAHAGTAGHAGTEAELKNVDQRLIRVETVQQRMETTMERMDDKLDRLLQQPTYRLPLPPSTPQP